MNEGGQCVVQVRPVLAVRQIGFVASQRLSSPPASAPRSVACLSRCGSRIADGFRTLVQRVGQRFNTAVDGGGRGRLPGIEQVPAHCAGEFTELRSDLAEHFCRAKELRASLQCGASDAAEAAAAASTAAIRILRRRPSS
ncbi:MAG TPA: hypothetical protein VFQ44_24035 [Streptosporangiaceae bacterium]|nr:hypothetical protein [Streptosporangiaceae bacterium]